VGSPHVISAGPIPRLVVGEVVTGGEPLRRLTADLGARCQAAFRDLEWRPSREPHVTLARFRKHARRSDGDTIVRALGGTDSSRDVRDDRVAVVQVIESNLTATSPAYTVVGGPVRGSPD
jgi:2'-5' RNA ligase